MGEAGRTVATEGGAAERLAELAALPGRSEDWYANFMIGEYAVREPEIVRALKAGLESALAGTLVPHDGARDRFRATTKRARRPAAE